jgi:hypothetical protein
MNRINGKMIESNVKDVEDSHFSGGKVSFDFRGI